MIVGTDLYPHMPILRSHAARYSTNGVESPTGTFIVLHVMANSSDFWLLGEQSFPKWEIPCLWHQWTTLQNLTLLALSSAEKSVTVQTKNTQTVTDIWSTTCLLACVD